MKSTELTSEEILDLYQQISGLEEEVGDLSDEANDLEETISDLEETISDLEYEIDKLNNSPFKPKNLHEITIINLFEEVLKKVNYIQIENALETLLSSYEKN